MKIAAIDSYGEKPSIRDVPPPAELAKDELLVRVIAAGMNPVDSAIAQGRMKTLWPARFPLTLGSDFAGKVERMGDAVARYRVGDAVYGKLTERILSQGAYGDYIHVPEGGCVSRMPKSIIGFSEAAALPTAAMTAIVCMDAVHLGKGARVLVNGATGGVGSCLTPLLARRGISVIATAHDDAVSYILDRGASTVIDYTREMLFGAVRARFPDGIDALVDLVSRDMSSLDELVELVRPRGSIVSTTHAAAIDALRVRGFRATNIFFRPDAELIGRVTKAIDDGDLPPPAVRTFSMDHLDEALAELRGGHVHGKLVLATL
jgi:NADPH:quinone reductase-like Zn-dependent oxidoreductase